MSTKVKNSFWYVVGFFIGILNALRHRIFGYSRPRPFSPKKLLETVFYNKKVVHDWERQLISYQEISNPFSGKDIVEIGPGYDYGAGVTLFSLGASSYKAIDRFFLSQGNEKYYKTLSENLRIDMIAKKLDPIQLSEVIQGIISQGNSYSSSIFSVEHSAIEDVSEKVSDVADVIVSQAVLEHVQDINKSFCVMYRLLRKGGVICHEIDFQTHTQVLRERDPLNIFRYSESQWKTWLTFPGCPNRRRPNDFVRAAQSAGFECVALVSIRSLSDMMVQEMKPFLAKPFQGEASSTLSILSAVLLARKP